MIKSIVSDGGHRIGNDQLTLEARAFLEGTCFYGGQRVGERECRKACTMVEGRMTNGHNGVGQVECGEVLAELEGTLTDGSERGRDDQRAGEAATAKSVGRDGGQAAGQGECSRSGRTQAEGIPTDA